MSNSARREQKKTKIIMRIISLVVGLGCLCAIGADEAKEEETKLQRCVPRLNLDALINGTLSPPPPPPPVAAGLMQSDEANSAELVLVEAPQVATTSLLSSLSFKVDDIELPLAPNEGSLHSAIKLISSFNDQFEVPEDGEGNDEDRLATMTDNVIRFSDNRLNIRGLNLTMLNIHLYTDSQPKFGLGVSLRNTTLSGQFTYRGPLQLSGFYRMSIENARLVASSNLTKAASLEPAGNLELSMRAKDFRLNITDLGYISIEILDAADSQRPTNNYLLRMLQRLLQKTIKRTYYTFENRIRECLEKESSQLLDCELKRFTPFLDQNFPTDGQHLEDLSRIIGQQIFSLQLHSVQLPSFEHHQSFLGANPTIQFHNGSLNGLNHMKLAGETRIKLQDEHLFVNSSIGWTDLRPYYNWALVLSNSSGGGGGGGGTSSKPSARGYVAFNIKTVEFDAVITKGLNPHTRLVVERLEIRRLDGPKMDIGGLPGLNRITRGMVNFFMGRLKQRLVSSIQPALKQQLERSLNRMQANPIG